MNKWIYDSKKLKIIKSKNNIIIVNKKTNTKTNIFNILDKTKKEAEEEKEIKYNYNADIEKKQLTIFDFL